MRGNTFLKYILIVVIVFVGCAFISANLFQFALIQGKSMEPAYHNMQLVMINKFSKDYQRGDVILFSCKNLDCTLIKRIVACPGDKVLIRDGVLFVNSKAESGYNKIEYAGIASENITLPVGCYFVLGDNYNLSKDSRYSVVGFVKADDILGRVESKHNDE